MFWNKPCPSVVNDLAALLADPRMQEDLLGVNKVEYPKPDKIFTDSARIVTHANSPEYKTWAKEAWAKFLAHMDVVMDPKSTTEQLHFARGAAASTLDLLRVAHQARLVNEQMAQERVGSVTARR